MDCFEAIFPSIIINGDQELKHQKKKKKSLASCLVVLYLPVAQGPVVEQAQPAKSSSDHLQLWSEWSEVNYVCLGCVPTCTLWCPLVLGSLRTDFRNKASVEHEQHSQAASSLHKNTPINILSADSLVNNQMTVRAPGFSAAATVIHADELKIQCPSSALLQSPIHVEVAEPVYLQFFPFLILMSGLAFEWPGHGAGLTQCGAPPHTLPRLLSPPVPYTCSRYMLPLRGLSAWTFSLQ